MTRRVALELLGFAALTVLVLLVILGVGQVARLADYLRAAPLLPLLGPLLLVLAEAALPLAGLVAAGLVYGRLRQDGALVAQAALGVRPAARLGPAVVLGGGLGASAAVLAWAPVPGAVETLRGRIVEAASSAVLRGDAAAPLPGGGIARTASDGVLWAALPGSGGEPPTLLRAGGAEVVATTAGFDLELTDAWLWGPRLRVRVGSARVALDDPARRRRLGMLGPPNSLPSPALEVRDPHHAFTWHRRLALPALAPLWALLGALLGGALGGAGAVLGSAALVGFAYWLLRAGELTARAGLMSPALAAWAPVLVVGLLLALLAPRLAD